MLISMSKVRLVEQARSLRACVVDTKYDSFLLNTTVIEILL